MCKKAYRRIVTGFLAVILVLGSAIPALAEEVADPGSYELLPEENMEMSQESMDDVLAESICAIPEGGTLEGADQVTSSEADAEIAEKETDTVLETVTENTEEDIVEAADEEMLLAAGKNRTLVVVDSENTVLTYTQKTSGTDGKGGTWKWDGNGNLELNNVNLPYIRLEGNNAVVTLTGDNYLGSLYSDQDREGKMIITGSGTLHINKLDPTLYSGVFPGLINSTSADLEIINTHIDITGQIYGNNILIRNSDIYMGNYGSGANISAGGSLLVDNSDITIEKQKYWGVSGASFELKGCSIVEEGVSVQKFDATYQGVASPSDSLPLNEGWTTLTIRREKSADNTSDTNGNANAASTASKRVPHISYRTHVQTYGWQNYVQDGAMSGTEGQAKRLEAINIKLSDLPYDGEIEYRTHVQTYGWQGWKSNDQMAGTNGEAKRLEAIQIRLTGEMEKYYDVYYQTHIQTFGWSGWAKNGEQCGSAGYSKRLEGIRIRLVKKGAAAPGNTTGAFYQKAGVSAAAEPTVKVSGAKVGYNTHVQTYGWQKYAYDGTMAGTSGKSKRLEGIHISLVDKPYNGDIVYRTHVQTYGWQAWKKNGEMSGTKGQSKRLEGIQIYLTGEMAKHYDVYYCVHAQTYGWLGWAKNGEMAGTSGLSKRLEGIKIVLVEKGEKVPGSTVKPNVVGKGGKLPDNPYSEA